MLPDKASLYLTAIEDSEYKEDKIECEPCDFVIQVDEYYSLLYCVNVPLISFIGFNE